MITELSPMHARGSESKARARDFIAEVTPRRRFDELILPDETMAAVQQLVEEPQRTGLLQSHSQCPRFRLEQPRIPSQRPTRWTARQRQNVTSGSDRRKSRGAILYRAV